MSSTGLPFDLVNLFTESEMQRFMVIVHEIAR